jgi:hypothetical protein
MTGIELRAQMNFEKALTIGSIVETRWTSCYRYYTSKAEVLKVNENSIVIKPLEVADFDKVNIPRIYNLRRWSGDNGVFPYQA